MVERKRALDEIQVFAGVAERTGNVIDTGGGKKPSRACTTMRDLARQYRAFGDGLFYLRPGQWPEGQTSIKLDEVNWVITEGRG